LKRAFGWGAESLAADYITHWKAILPVVAFPPLHEEVWLSYIRALSGQLDMIVDGYGFWTGIKSALGIPLDISDTMIFDENIMEYARLDIVRILPVSRPR
jgi:hypothetical protein